MKLLLLAGLVAGCFWYPGYMEGLRSCVPMVVQPEDVWCSGAQPDCVSHVELWVPVECGNSLPPTYEVMFND